MKGIAACVAFSTKSFRLPAGLVSPNRPRNTVNDAARLTQGDVFRADNVKKTQKLELRKPKT